MSEQRLDLRLDLSQYPEVDRGDCFDFPHSTAQDYMALRSEALRAQASEDALRERVQVLEEWQDEIAQWVRCSAGHHYKCPSICGGTCDCGLDTVLQMCRHESIMFRHDFAPGGGKESE